MKHIKWFISLLSIITVSAVSAQQFGAFPPSFKWKQINTDTARIIFTKGAEDQAQRIATLIHKASADTPFAIGPRLRKINVVLHSQTTLANGYVALAPFRSEYYLIPGSGVFEFGNMPWYENLGIHEYRHVQQYNNFRNGLSKGFYYLFGEEGLALANALAVPNWFYEGDAVHAETALTEQGRGRLSLFLSGYNSLFLENKHYSWMKLRNGSLKDYVPDHYQLGYLLVNYGYLKYGSSFWKNVTYDATAFKGLFYPFQKAIRKYSGEDFKAFRKDALNYYEDKLGRPNDTIVSKRPVVNYYFPQYIAPDSLLYLRTAYNRLPAFYISDHKGMHKISLHGISSEEWFSYRNGKIAFTRYSTNPRWSLVDYSDIILLDITNKKEKRITRKNRYFTPDINPSGDKVAAIRINDSLHTDLDILNLDGRLLQRITPPGNYYLTNPRYIDNSHIVVGTRTPDSRMTLQMLDLSTGAWEPLLPFTYHTIGLPFVSQNMIFFTANFNVNDDIYVMRLKDRQLARLTNGFTGNYYASAYGDSLVWSHFTAEGLRLRKESLDRVNWGSVNAMQIGERTFIYPVALEKDITAAPSRQFAVTSYRKSTGLFHFHSWSPNYVDPEFTFSLYSDNILNTFSNELYYLYNRNESSNAIGWNSSYGGLFPVLNAGVEYIYNRSVNTTSGFVLLNQFEARAGFDIPLNFTKGKTYKLLDFGSNFVYSRVMPSAQYKDSINTENTTYLSHFINWSHYLPLAVQHIYPKLGYTLYINHRHQLNQAGYQLLGEGSLFLPSFSNHSIVLTGAFQETDTNNVLFSNRFPISRGYPGYYFSRMWKVAGNYHFPIVYPDLGFANILYVQRVRGNLFYDFTRVYSPDKSAFRNLRSTGAELFFDTKWWNELPVSFGIRYSYLLDNNVFGDHQTYFELILPTDLISRYGNR